MVVNVFDCDVDFTLTPVQKQFHIQEYITGNHGKNYVNSFKYTFRAFVQNFLPAVWYSIDFDLDTKLMSMIFAYSEKNLNI